MRTLSLLVVFTMLFAGCTSDDQPAAETGNASVVDAADTVYINGKVYTVNQAQPWAEAIAVKDGRFLVVGSASDVAPVTRTVFCSIIYPR
jgi:hypothetical protein